ncbi:unnamed protein product [Phytophthora lilii]|uniref:Unnamed protein product n=1 Tax=Phytophthora lilii TaxID=2077276 RepID=A0A9W6TNN5_9STRA|nr:unnamed protein product [Phytophthora lilii]
MAADVSARVHLVAEKLQQKAQDAQRKGNEGAARALAASVADLRVAMALLAEQRHLLARRRGEGDDEEDEADARVRELAARLARVEAMLGKKAEDMRLKGNEGAAAALQQSAAAVDRGRALLEEQQQSIFGLLGRWEKLQDVVEGKSRRRSSVATSDGEEEQEEDTPHGRIIARVRQLVQLEAAVKEVFPEWKLEDVREEMEKLKEKEQELRDAREETQEVNDMLKQESLALEEAKKELEAVRERELLRQEEDAALLEQQREACQAMEQLVRESDQEIQRMTQTANERAEELQSLRIELESFASEKERLVRAHNDEIEELQGQLASAMDALSTKADENANTEALQVLQTKIESLTAENAEELQVLQSKIESLATEKEELVKAHADEAEKLQEAHANEVKELQKQLESTEASLSAQSQESAGLEQLESLQSQVDNLTLEKEEMLKSSAAEVEKLQNEIEELRRQLEDAVNSLSVESTAIETDEMQSLISRVDTLTSEKEALVKSHEDELEELRRQLDSMTPSLTAQAEKSDADYAEELQSLRDEISSLVSQKNDLAESHASELEKLQEVHLREIDELHLQLDTATAALSTKSEKSASEANELQQLRAEVGALTIEKDHLVKEHADEIEKLNHQVDTGTTETESVSEDHNDSDTFEGEDTAENEDAGDVPVLELEEEDSQQTDIAAEDEVEASSVDRGNVIKSAELQAALDDLQSKIAGYEERSESQKDTISALERQQLELQGQIEVLMNDKAQAVDELRRSYEAETLKLQVSIDGLHAQVTEYEDRYEAQQSIISSLENEQAALLEKIELLTNEKEQVVGELQSSHRDETLQLTQRIADFEDTIESLSSQLKELKNSLAAKSSEHDETSAPLQRCEAELSSCQTVLDGRIHECNQLKSALEATQSAEDAKSIEVDNRLSLLTTELHEIIAGFSSRSEEAEGFVEKEWQCPELMKLSRGIASLQSDLSSVQKQLQGTEEQLDSLRQKEEVIHQFVRTSDWRLFARDGEEEEKVVTALKANKDLREHLAAAKANSLRWLEELQQLRERVEKAATQINNLEKDKLEEKERSVALEGSQHDLEVLVESLKEQLTAMRDEKEEMERAAEKLKAQNHSASIQKQQVKVAQQEEVAELQQQLSSVRSDFERYRVRSHTALKKMEKRAELLNGMRKENEALLKQIKESDQQRELANAARKDSEARLQEVQRTQEMMQADFDQFATEKARIIAELEEEGQRLVSEREETDKQIQKLTQRIQETENEKMQVEEESERIKEAEQAAFQARLSTATTAVQTAKQDLQKVHDALEASKAENNKRQKRVELLEAELEQAQANIAATVDSSTTSLPVPNTIIQAPTAYVPVLTPPSAEEKRNVAGLEKELTALRSSEVSLRNQLDDARAELIALQERFATTKAANAEKVFALEEQISHWKMELDTATEEVRRLNSLLEAQKSTATHGNGTLPVLTQDQTKVTDQHQQDALKTRSERIQQPSRKVLELEEELADANTEITLLTRSLDACREELQSARDQIDVLAPSSSEPESGDEPTGASKTSTLLASKDEALKKLRVQVLELQEEIQTLREEKAELELEREKEELDELQASCKHMQSEKERAMQLQRRQVLVSGFEKQVASIVDELQHRLEDHSSAFREVCDFRDQHREALRAENEEGLASSRENKGRANDPEFEECLVMRSGVVIKAGASFQLPVICEKRGWRVVWNFSVKEDAADVAFKLCATMVDETSTEVEVVSPERMNEMSGVFQVQQDNTTLVFEWDNSFSWLNEKTLDYHVSIQEPLTPQAQKVRRSERELQAKAKLLEEGLALIEAEAQRRSDLSATLKRLGECEAAKNKHLAEFGARKTEVLTQKSHFQEEMEAQKTAFSAMLREQDELEDVERSISRAWDAAVAELEDVEMTLQLAGNGAQLETLAQEFKEQAETVVEQLKNPVRLENPIASKNEEEASTPPKEQGVVTDDKMPEGSTAQSDVSEALEGETGTMQQGEGGQCDTSPV